MDFWKKQIAQAQAIAKQGQEKLKVVAEQAKEQAKKQAEKAREDLKNLNLKDVANSVKADLIDAGRRLAADAGLAPDQAEEYANATPGQVGISRELKDFLGTLTYLTFREFDDSEAASSLPEIDDDTPLDAWQVRHVTLLLEEVEQVQSLRFALCPRHMTEARFWQIYFHLTRTYLPSTDEGRKELLDRHGPQGAESTSGAAAAGGAAAASSDAAKGGAESEEDLEDYINGVLGSDGGEGGGDDDTLEGLEDDGDLDEYLNAIGDGDGDDGDDAIDLDGIDDADLDDLDDDYLRELGASSADGEEADALGEPPSAVAVEGESTDTASREDADGTDGNDSSIELDDEDLAELEELA